MHERIANIYIPLIKLSWKLSEVLNSYSLIDKDFKGYKVKRDIPPLPYSS